MELGQVVQQLINTWGTLPLVGKVFAGLFIVSEILSFVPSISANGVFQAIKNVASKLNPFKK